MEMLAKIRQKKSVIRAVAYARFSSDNQREASIDAQLREINKYACQNDVLLVDKYCDSARSGRTDNRDAFQKMIVDSKANMFDVVIVHKLDRFARNRADSIGYRTELKRNGVDLISVEERFDDSPEGIILLAVIEAMAEYYSRNLARETMKGLVENALNAMHTGGCPPFGYDVDKKTKKLIVNETEAAIIQYIFSTIENGGHYRQIIEELNSRGILTKRGNAFGKNSLHGILRNEKYTGTYIFNRVASKDIDGKRNNNVCKSNDEIIRIPNGVPQIISQTTFDNVQKRLPFRSSSCCYALCAFLEYKNAPFSH